MRERHTMAAPAGWYPDPEVDHQRRYWDGQRWTERRAPVVIPRTNEVLEQESPRGHLAAATSR